MVFVPVDVIKERLQVTRNLAPLSLQTSPAAGPSALPQYRNSWDAFRQILRSEGLRGAYKGYSATLLSYGPFSALYFLFYEKVGG